MLKRTSGIKLPKTHPRFQEIEASLNRYVNTFTNEVVNMVFYEDCDDHILIPRFYPIPDETIIDNSSEGEDIEIESKVTPLNETQGAIMKFMENQKSVVLQLECGRGKTTIMCNTIAKIKKRTIVVNNKKDLLKQWKAELLTHTTLKDEDIDFLSSKNYKTCLKKKVILTTPQVISYAVKHKNQEFLDTLFNSDIGIMVVDEAHTNVGPEHFSKSSLYINCKRVFGLSATPYRNDGNEDVIRYHLGEVKYFPPEEEEMLIPKVYMVYIPFGIYSRHKKYLEWGGNFSIGRYYQQMVHAENFNKAIAMWVRKANKGNRKVLVLGNRIDSLLKVAEHSNLPKEEVGVFIPGATEKEKLKVSDTCDSQTAFKTKNVVFSTYGACRDGNNRKELDFLIMQAPTQNVEQAAGRVLRRLDGKKQPIILDIVDTDGPKVDIRCDDGHYIQSTWFERAANKRLNFYRKKGWEIVFYKYGEQNKNN